MWFLLGGRVPWRKLLPCAVATGAFWIGMLVVFHFISSGMVEAVAQLPKRLCQVGPSIHIAHDLAARSGHPAVFRARIGG
jgi:hypothetical protein